MLTSWLTIWPKVGAIVYKPWVPLVLLAGCSAAEPPEPALTFAANPQAYCQARDPDWLVQLVARIEAAAPVGADVQFQQLMVQDALVDGQLGPGEREEVQLRITNGGENLAAYGVIDPVTCAVGPMEVYAPLRLLDGTAPRFIAP